jgi:hypothetical protein
VGDKITSTCAHNHLSDPGTVASKQIQEDVLKKAAQNPKLKTAALVDEFATRTEDPSFRTRTVTIRSFQRHVQRAKAKALFKPKAPKSFDDLAELPEEYKVYTLRICKTDCRLDFIKILMIVVRIPACFLHCCTVHIDLVAVDDARGPILALQHGSGGAHSSGAGCRTP